MIQVSDFKLAYFKVYFKFLNDIWNYEYFSFGCLKHHYIIMYLFDMKMSIGDWEQWFIPVIPALWEAKLGRSLEVRSSRAAWPTWRNPISTKNTKIKAGHGGSSL